MRSRKLDKVIVNKKQEDLFFFRKFLLIEPQGSNLDILSSYSTVTKFYMSLQDGYIENNEMKIKNCYALILAQAIIEKITSGNIKIKADNSFTEDFYISLAREILHLFHENDEELVVIYLKQMMHILRSAGIVQNNKRIATISCSLSREELFIKILKSFWNETEWKNIFPSSPELAERLFSTRSIFIDFLGEFFIPVDIGDFIRDFFEMTEIAERDDAFAISFVEFYLINWMNNFGIVDYESSLTISKVMLSEYGRKILALIK
ncbi:MAG TPA: hypothetical protein PLA51_01005 [Spirochaetota bacterium]|jgi:hypothetical protein|nr:hypothetical protein [Spirochaetota bacterium]OQA99641.1 MAG: hypothetical protein BWY23_00608 [Spirochaetes bacterium ADurb.Bin218]HON15033.1 hypothetical protein [Spirochaetota bacterium]HOQ13436.1 hypothetical protein [Spirochaetota bacterium]HPD76911.1 hypothetical protein [Spirochaetota bacterium]